MKLLKKVMDWKEEFDDGSLAFVQRIEDKLLNEGIHDWLSGEDPSTLKGRTRIIENSLKEAPLVGGGNLDFAGELAEHGLSHPGHVISPNGYIRGNDVGISIKIAGDTTMFEWCVEHKEVFIRHGYPTGDSAVDLEYYRECIKNNEGVFEQPDTSEEIGFPGIDDHPDFKDGIFKELVGGIRSTYIEKGNATIFIDIFFLGETIGVVIAKRLSVLLRKIHCSMFLFCVIE